MDYQKLYDQERKSNRDLNSRLDDVCRLVRDAAVKLKHVGLYHALPTDSGQDRANRANRTVEALVIEFEQSISLLQNKRRRIHELEEKILKENTEHAMNESRMENEIKQIQRDRSNEIRQIQNERSNEKERMDDKISRMKKDFKHEKEQLKDGFESSKVQTMMLHQRELSQVREDHARQETALKEDIKALNEALGAREQVKSLSDNDIESLFLTLVGLVDQMARRSTWKHNRTEWKDEVFDLARNSTKLKRNILQESMWIVLYENIFCTPFRIFGEEGRYLETQWSAAFGGGQISRLLLLRHC